MNKWVGCIYMSFLANRKRIAAMPYDNVYNSGSQCDASLGYCSCGASHYVNDWVARLTGKNFGRTAYISLNDGATI